MPRQSVTLGRAVLLAALLSCSGSGAAPAQTAPKSLYVNGATGNDAVSYADNGPSAPWKTIGRAAWGSTNRDRPNASEAARAGDTVLVAEGTYGVAGPNSRNVPSYNPANSGSPGRPITFRAEGKVVLTLTSGIGSVIGSYERNHITWDGFTIDENNARSHSDTGPVTLWFCDGCVLQNLDITGNGDDFGRQDNHTGIRLEWTSNILVRNNRIRNVQTAHNPNNGAAIQTYNTGGVIFEHNHISHSGSGIFIKGGAPGGPKNDYFTIRYNLIHDIGRAEGGNAIALHVGAGNRPEAPVRVYQNVLRNVREAGIKLWMFNGTDPTMNPRNAKIVNNTIDRATHALWVTHALMPASGHVFANNIATNISGPVIEYGAFPPNVAESGIALEHNLYFRYAGPFANFDSRYSFDDWKRTFRLDTKAPGSREADPQFVNAEQHDYRLKPGSPALNAGVDLLDLNGDKSSSDPITIGAYITGRETIGRLPGR